MAYPFSKIAMLGQGITAKAVLEKLPELNLEHSSVEKCDLIVASPGIPPSQYPNTDIPIISEIEFAYRLFQNQNTAPYLIGITGTNGKSTVTALTSRMLDIPYAGNIGVPLISFVNQTHKAIVVELSSYQLERCTTFRPNIGVLLNLTPDHLERHGTMDAYLNAKWNLFQSQTSTDWALLGDDPLFFKKQNSLKAQVLILNANNSDWPLTKNLPLVGHHNQLNALAAIKIAKIYGLSEAKIIEKLQSFQGLEHRIEFVLHSAWGWFYNDSKGTNPDSTLIAVDAFESKTVHLILGGKDKGLELLSFFESLAPKVASFHFFGECGPRMQKSLSQVSSNAKSYLTETLEQALQNATSLSQKDHVILFSPACSSFDQFNNFEHRGKVFKQLVHEHYNL